MTIMKKILLVFTTLIILNNLIESQRVYEFGLIFDQLSPNNLGLSFKAGNNKSLLSLSLLNLDFDKFESNVNGLQSNTRYWSIGLGLGYERNKQLDDKFTFVYGVDLRYSYFWYKFQNTDNHPSINNPMPSLGAIIGFKYYFTDKVSILGEVVPSVYYGHNSSSHSTSDHYGFSLFSNSASITLSYRLTK
jgi:hypothetical protein